MYSTIVHVIVTYYTAAMCKNVQRSSHNRVKNIRICVQFDTHSNLLSQRNLAISSICLSVRQSESGRSCSRAPNFISFFKPHEKDFRASPLDSYFFNMERHFSVPFSSAQN